MSKVANMLNLVEILKDGKVHSIKELSQKLEVTERMIRAYKLELDQTGIYINGIKGIYGGYVLDKESTNIDIGLSQEEINILERVKDFSNCSLKDNDELQIIINKIVKSYKKNAKVSNEYKYDTIKKDNNKLSTIYKDFRNAINNRNKIYIDYISVNSGITKRIIHPAELFTYKNDWYSACFCELRNEIRLFKLQDITKYKVLKEHYGKDFEINIK